MSRTHPLNCIGLLLPVPPLSDSLANRPNSTRKMGWTKIFLILFFAIFALVDDEDHAYRQLQWSSKHRNWISRHSRHFKQHKTWTRPEPDSNLIPDPNPTWTQFWVPYSSLPPPPPFEWFSWLISINKPFVLKSWKHANSIKKKIFPKIL